MKKEWEQLWLPVFALAAIAAGVGLAFMGYWALAVVAAVAAGAAAGALATMLAFSARDASSNLSAETAQGAELRASRDEAGTLHGDIDTLRGDLDTLRGEIKTWHEEIKAWRGEIKTSRKEIKTWHGELIRLVNSTTSNAAKNTVAVAGSAVAAAWTARPAPERVDAALPLVLIAQIQRSGGTLLSQQFDGHPEILAFPHELKWGGQIKYRWPMVNPRTEGSLRIARSLVAENLRHNDLFNLVGYHKPALALDDLDQHLPFQWSQWNYVEAFLDAWKAKPPETRRECFDIFMSSYFSGFFDWRIGSGRKKIVTAFTPRTNFVKSYPENMSFFEDYPDGLMISICRHPADWYASARPHQPQFYEDTAEAMALWRESTECAIQLKKQLPSNVFLVQFASLVTDPEGSMRRIADRLGLTWDPILLVPTFNGMPVASNSSFNPSTGIDVLTLARRESLEKPLRSQIEAENLKLYERFVGLADV